MVIGKELVLSNSPISLSPGTCPITSWLLWEAYSEAEISMQDTYDGVQLGSISLKRKGGNQKRQWENLSVYSIPTAALANPTRSSGIELLGKCAPY